MVRVAISMLMFALLDPKTHLKSNYFTFPHSQQKNLVETTYYNFAPR